VLFLVASAFVHQLPSRCPTPLSRLDLLHALAAGRIDVDAYSGNTPDRASYAMHSYSDKAPGTVALALPAFTAAAASLRATGVDLDSPHGWLISSWAACVGSIVAVAAIGASLLFAWLTTHVESRGALIATLAVFLGAAPLPYATMMSSHSLVAGLIAVSVWAMANERTRNEVEERTITGSTRQWFVQNRWDLLAGFTCGWALASEFTAGIIIVGLVVWLAFEGWRRIIPFCSAALPPLLLIPLYSWLCFRNPFLLPYSLNESFPEMRRGVYAIMWPDAQTAYNLLFSPTRGLFFWSPFLLMAGIGYWRLIQIDRRLFWLTYAVPLVQIIVISGRTWDWTAGPSLGPRYLAPILPLLALPCALGMQRFPRIGIALAGYSILITTVATLTNACPPGHVYNPLLELHLPALLKGELAPNLGTAVGLPAWGSVALFYAILIGGIAWLWRRAPTAEAEVSQ
jgi:hypothetical protein